MNWDDARIFLAVARAQQILAAARSLGLNHATVARRLDALERALGTRLVTRTPVGSTLTIDGERLLPHAERIESEVIAAREATGASSTDIAGVVRVGAPDGFGVGYLAPRLGKLLDRHPALRIELVPAPRSFSLSRREADLAVTLERPREGRLVAQKLVAYTLGLYAAKDYLGAFGTPRKVADLAGHRLVGYVEDLLYSVSLDYAGEFYSGWRSVLSVSTAMGQVEAVRAGAGIGILHRFMARPSGLTAVLPSMVAGRDYWLVVHEDLRSIRRVVLVADFIREEVRKDRALF
jgi:DNA-binding transcriptional LysR family regulator